MSRASGVVAGDVDCIAEICVKVSVRCREPSRAAGRQAGRQRSASSRCSVKSAKHASSRQRNAVARCSENSIIFAPKMYVLSLIKQKLHNIRCYNKTPLNENSSNGRNTCAAAYIRKRAETHRIARFERHFSDTQKFAISV